MNVTGAYNQFGIFGGQETQRTSAVADKVQPKVQPLFTSGGDTVSISPEAQEALARANDGGGFDFSQLEPGFNERMAALIEATQAGLEDGSIKMKMFNDPTCSVSDPRFFPNELMDFMPKFSDLPKLSEMPSPDERTNALNGQQGRAKFNAAMEKAGRAVNAYLEAMRKSGIDGSDPEALYQFSKDSEKQKAVGELFLNMIGESS